MTELFTLPIIFFALLSCEGTIPSITSRSMLLSPSVIVTFSLTSFLVRLRGTDLSSASRRGSSCSDCLGVETSGCLGVETCDCLGVETSDSLGVETSFSLSTKDLKYN